MEEQKSYYWSNDFIRKHPIPDADYIMSWVTPLTIAESSPRIFFGPQPRKWPDVHYLVTHLEVNGIVNLTKEDNKLYYPNFFPDKQGAPALLNHPFDPSTFERKGRLKTDQRKHLAMHYVNLGRKLVDTLLVPDPTYRVYVHDRNGFQDAVLVGMAMWACLGGGPPDPVQWIKNRGNNLLLDDDEEQRQLLAVIWKEAQAIDRAEKMFGLKRRKKE